MTESPANPPPPEARGPRDVVRFWTEGLPPSAWYKADAALDEEIRARFFGLWQQAKALGTAPWRGSTLALFASVILLDQFPRNMFRGDPQAFALDPQARDAARAAIRLGQDRDVPRPARQFFYLPFTHSERMADQAFGCHHALRGMGPGETHLHAQAHREVIARFARFPHRNAVLGRETTAEETAFLEAGGYAALVRRLRDQGAAMHRAR